jgi:hypothetical protein
VELPVEGQDTMRWDAFAAALSVDTHSRLINLITAGRGYVWVAIKLAQSDGEADAVLAQAEQALNAFDAARALLPRAKGAAAPDASLPATRQAPAEPWQSWLSARSAAEAAQLAAGVVTDDSEVAALVQELDACVTCLERLCRVAGEAR